MELVMEWMVVEGGKEPVNVGHERVVIPEVARLGGREDVVRYLGHGGAGHAASTIAPIPDIVILGLLPPAVLFPGQSWWHGVVAAVVEKKE